MEYVKGPTLTQLLVNQFVQLSVRLGDVLRARGETARAACSRRHATGRGSRSWSRRSIAPAQRSHSRRNRRAKTRSFRTVAQCPAPRRRRVQQLLAQLCDKAGLGGKAERHRGAAITEMRSLGDRRATAELLLGDTPTKGALVMGRLDDALALTKEIGWSEGHERTKQRSEPPSMK